MNRGLAEVQEGVKEWLQKAKNDLLSARILLEHDPPVLDTACFHCQQTVEKGLKAFLIWNADERRLRSQRNADDTRDKDKGFMSATISVRSQRQFASHSVEDMERR